MSNLLITGGTGYIGCHTAVALVNFGHNVVLYDNLSNSNFDVVSRLAKITGVSLPFVQGDVRNTDFVEQTLSQYNIDAVIHFAGLKSINESVIMPMSYYSNNVQGTISLLKAMQKCNIKKLVFSSTANVYGQPQTLPIDESHPTCPNNPYGRSKLHIEEILNDFAICDREWRIVNLRYFNPAGAHSSGFIGENPIGIPNNLVPYMVQVATGQRDILTIFGNDYATPDGTGIRDYIHVMDLAEGHVAALNFLDQSVGCHVFNLGTGTFYSVLDIVHAFGQATGCKIPYEIAKRRPGDVAACYANAQKANKLMSWTAKRNINEMCLSAWNFQQSIR